MVHQPLLDDGYGGGLDNNHKGCFLAKNHIATKHPNGDVKQKTEWYSESGLADRHFINSENSSTSLRVHPDDVEPIPISDLKPRWMRRIGNSTKTEIPARAASCETIRRMFERWTKLEDKILLQAVTTESGGGHTNKMKWKKIATQYFMDSRTHRQCSGRWKRMVDPSVNLAAWTEEEDTIIIQLKKQMGIITFSYIAKKLPVGRTPEAVRARWIIELDPNITKLRWTQQEKESLYTKVTTHGTKWKWIAQQHFPGRSEISYKNIWFNKLQSEQRRQKRSAKEQAKDEGIGMSPRIG